MLERIGRSFEALVRRWMPDPFILAIALTFVTLLAARLATAFSFDELLQMWLNGPATVPGVPAASTGGFWVLLEFSMQMVLIVVTGEAVATAPLVRGALSALARIPRGRCASVAFVSFVAMALGWIHWGFGLVAAAMLAREVAAQAKARGTRLHYPLMGAAAYTALLIWHAGLSGSAPLGVNSKTHFLFAQIGQVGLSRTVLTPMNLFACGLLLFTVPWVVAALLPAPAACVEIPDEAPLLQVPENSTTEVPTFATRVDASPLWSWLLAGLGAIVLGEHFYRKGFDPNLNIVNFIFLLLGLVLYGSPVAYMKAAARSMKGAAGIVIQFPLYGGIMGIVQGSGLGHMIAEFFSAFANARTLPFFTYVSSVLSKLFVPSGGGEWAIEGPVMLQAAARMGADTGKTIMAVAYGNMVGNMFQPFWALPLLGIMNLKARDIMGYCLVLFCFAAPILGAILLLFP